MTRQATQPLQDVHAAAPATDGPQRHPACEFCSLRMQTTPPFREFRVLTMHNGTTFRVCRLHLQGMAETTDDGRNGYVTAARERGSAWTFPQWEAMPLAEVDGSGPYVVTFGGNDGR